jgi:glycosyltransferase involved in cell wall biosynthesis
MGLDVHLIPTWSLGRETTAQCEAMGCTVDSLPGPEGLSDLPGLRGATVVSFCCKDFLDNAARLRDDPLRCRLVWANCMTWLFPKEEEIYKSLGPFDAYMFQSHHQKGCILPRLKRYGVKAAACHRIPGAFYPDEYPFSPRSHHAPDEPFVFGRLARSDPSKHSSNTWPIANAVLYPKKKVRIMGWSDKIESKLGKPPGYAEVLPTCAEPAAAFLQSLHAVLAINGGAGENWPRVGLEAMATGVPLVVQKQWGWPEMIRHGETGILTSDNLQEIAYQLSRLAWDEDYRLGIVHRAHQRLRTLADPERIARGWTALFEGVGHG